MHFYIYILVTFYGSGAENYSFLRVRGNSDVSNERHAHRLPSTVRGAMLARPARRVTYHRALGSGETRSEGSSMLIDDPLGEESNVSSTDSELWRVENSFLRMRGSSDAPKGAACS